MKNPEETQPPVTPRNLLKRALAWAKGHPAVMVPAGTFLLGLVLGWLWG